MPEEQHPILLKLAELEQSGKGSLESITEETALEQWRIAYLGRSSEVMTVFSQLPQLPRELRPVVGQRANAVKQALETAFTIKAETLHAQALERALAQERLDVTLPGRPQPRGRLHIQTRVLREIYRIFGNLGFQVFRSPEVETDEYNFGLLNMPPHHPARDMWDTFHLTQPGLVLRTHTSPGQIHAMRQFAPKPIRVILPGMCYRYEQTSVRHEFQFTQVEGLMIGRQVTLADLKGTLREFARQMYGATVRTRFRPSYFPFTEPSAEMDVECFICGGVGCNMCKQSGWLEILGCGVVHPEVLKNGGYDPREFTGFAFGMGPERVSILRHKIDDIRYFWANDVRFLEQL